jgi:hypothetical protein
MGICTQHTAEMPRDLQRAAHDTHLQQRGRLTYTLLTCMKPYSVRRGHLCNESVIFDTSLAVMQYTNVLRPKEPLAHDSDI